MLEEKHESNCNNETMPSIKETSTSFLNNNSNNIKTNVSANSSADSNSSSNNNNTSEKFNEISSLTITTPIASEPSGESSQLNTTVKSNSLLKGKLKNSNIMLEFQELDIGSNNDVGFHILDVSRHVLSMTLACLSDNPLHREELSKEIFDSFFTYSQTNGLEGLSPDSNKLTKLPRLKKLYKACEEAQTALDKTGAKIRQTLPDEATKQLRVGELIDWLEMMKCFKDTGELKAKIVQIHKSRDALQTYCKELAVFKYYVEALEVENLPLGYKSAFLYAKRANISIYIWKQDKKKSEDLELLDYYVSGKKSKKIVHIFPRGQHFTNFSILIPKDPEEEETSELDKCRIACVNEGALSTLRLLHGLDYYKDFHLLREWQHNEKNEVWKTMLQVRYKEITRLIKNLIQKLGKFENALSSDEKEELLEKLELLNLNEEGYPDSGAETYLLTLHAKIAQIAKRHEINITSIFLDNFRENFKSRIYIKIKESQKVEHLFLYGSPRGTLARECKEVLTFPITTNPKTLQMLLLQLLDALKIEITNFDIVRRQIILFEQDQQAKEENIRTDYQTELKTLFERREQLFTDRSLSKVNGDKLYNWVGEIEAKKDLSIIRNKEGKNLLEILCTLTTDINETHEDCTKFLVTICLLYNYRSVLQEALLWLHKVKFDPSIYINNKVYETIFNVMKDFYERSYLNMIKFEPSVFEHNVLTVAQKHLNNDVGFGRRLLNFFLSTETKNQFNEQAEIAYVIACFANSVQGDEALMGWIYHMLLKDQNKWIHPFKAEFQADADRYLETTKDGKEVIIEGKTDGFVFPMRKENAVLEKQSKKKDELLEKKDQEIEEYKKLIAQHQEEITRLRSGSGVSTSLSYSPTGSRQTSSSSYKMDSDDKDQLTGSIPISGRSP